MPLSTDALLSMLKEFPQGRFPDLWCPVCDRASLVTDPEGVELREDASSRAAQSDDNWEPDWITGFFTAWFSCTNRSCSGETMIVGTYRLDYDPDPKERIEYLEKLTITHTVPPIRVIDAPRAPEVVKDALKDLGSLVLVDPAAAISRMRFALERVMDAENVPDVDLSKKPVSLSSRLQTFAKSSQATREFFDALRWLGNEATHVGSMEPSDVADAVAILEHALRIIYPGNLQTRAAQIVRDRGTGR